MAYSVLLAPLAERQFKAFPQPVQKHLIKRFKTLQANPRPQGVKKLVGEDDLYRVREGNHHLYDPRQRPHCSGPQDRRPKKSLPLLILDHHLRASYKQEKRMV